VHKSLAAVDLHGTYLYMTLGTVTPNPDLRSPTLTAGPVPHPGFGMPVTTYNTQPRPRSCAYLTYQPNAPHIRPSGGSFFSLLVSGETRSHHTAFDKDKFVSDHQFPSRRPVSGQQASVFSSRKHQLVTLRWEAADPLLLETRNMMCLLGKAYTKTNRR